MAEHWILALLIVATSVSAAVIALLLIGFFIHASKRSSRTHVDLPAMEQVVFLFDEECLIDATTPARALLDAAPMANTDWARIASFLAPRFENFSGALQTLAKQGRIDITSQGNQPPLRLIAEDINGLARITLIDPEAEGQGILVDGLSHRALEDEVLALRTTMDKLPVLAWREDASGAVIWANRSYLLRSDALEAEDETLVWPLPRLFDAPAHPEPEGAARRQCLGATSSKPAWFETHCFTQEHGALHFAIPADATVRAERALREFVQTLTKTFADLPIGLAIFDRQRQLQLFNPALIDLLQLSPDFLSGRPTLYALLDRLREARMMPEPKDYRCWRQQMTALETAAAAGHHSETWSLPGGQTYRVTGRPHPDGAVAFLFEDITSEVSLTRRFRAELELSQEVLDAMQEAAAVFLPSGELVTSNAAYARLWGVDPSATLGRITMLDSVRIWQESCQDSAIWSRVRDFATRIDKRAMWAAEVQMTDGSLLECRFSPLSSGATLAAFSRLRPKSEPAPPRSGSRLSNKLQTHEKA